MGANHFLNDDFLIVDHIQSNLQHEIELFENAGKLFFRLWINGKAADCAVVGEMTKEQAQHLSDAVQLMAARLS